MLQFDKINSADVGRVVSISKETWFITYRTIISIEQMTFMYEKMYTQEALNEQIEEGNHFILFHLKGEDVGFFSYSLLENTSIIKIPKLYILPKFQGKKIGRDIIQEIKNIGRALGKSYIELNVNRNNPAVGFYLKTGFWIRETVDIPYFDFVLNDYVMVQNI